MRGTGTASGSSRAQRPSQEAATAGVVLSCPHEAENPYSHEAVTRKAIAEKLALLKGYEYGGDYRDGATYETRVYFVPGATIVGLEHAHAMGIHGEDDLFGGVVPLPFVGTKTITHPLPGVHAAAPDGWSAAFADDVQGAVLPGYSAFSPADARQAGERLLKTGPVRVKPARAIGGRGQVVVNDLAMLDDAIDALDTAELACYGVALEQNMDDVKTYSVGQVRVAELVATYFGTQKLVKDNCGEEVYGGSDLTIARGGFDALLDLDLEPDARAAISHARTYDRAAREFYAGLFASRCNYDVARGRDREGRTYCGVLEQSWRIGGASGAEIGALEAFRDTPELRAVRAQCTEVYGESAAPPADATVYFRGIDPEVGLITKYVTVKRDAYA